MWLTAFGRLRQTRGTCFESQKRNVANAVGYLQGQTFTYDDKKNQRQLAERPNKITKKKCKSPKMSVKIAGEKKVDGGKNEKRAEEREGKGGKGKEREGKRRKPKASLCNAKRRGSRTQCREEEANGLSADWLKLQRSAIGLQGVGCRSRDCKFFCAMARVLRTTSYQTFSSRLSTT